MSRKMALFQSCSKTKKAFNEKIFNTSSLHVNEFRVRLHNYHSLVPSHEKRIVVSVYNRQLEKFKSHVYTHCRTKNLNFSEGTQIEYEKLTEEKKSKVQISISFLLNISILSQKKNRIFFVFLA